MFLRVSFCFLLVKMTSAQLSDFFWINDEFNSYYGSIASTPSTDLSPYNGDSLSNFFINYNQMTNGPMKEESTKDLKMRYKNMDENILAKTKLKNFEVVIWSKANNENYKASNFKNSPEYATKIVSITTEKNDKNITEDSFEWFETFDNKNKNKSVDKYSHIKSYEKKVLENICTFMPEINCTKRNGYANTDIIKQKKENGKGVSRADETLICCILPLKNSYHNSSKKDAQKILPDEFLESYESIERPKRSEDIAQKQRNILLKRKYAHPNHKSLDNAYKKTAHNDDYEYEDPYWNIKTKENANHPKQKTITRYNVKTDDYRDDYAGELPKPSLSSISSDNDKRHHGWTVSHGNKGSSYDGSDDYDVDDSGYGHSTIDPRIGIEKRRKAISSRFTRTTTEPSEDPEIQTAVNINYHTHPDTNSAVHEFKLLNFLKKSKKKFEMSSQLPLTIETVLEDENTESYDNNQETSSEDFKERQIFKGCGKSLRSIPTAMKEIDKQIADTENGSHPWMGLLVPTRKLNNLLCYASLIHPRAALSAADCVHRSSPREVTLIVGLWNLNERSRLKSRIVTVYIHPKYKGQLSNNLALLHWKRPLRLGVNVHPVCLSNPRLGADCLFVGWGGFDQGIHSRSKWQRATIHSCNDHLSLNGISIPPEAFCASVEASNTVTGFGGSLVCNIHGRLSAVGVAISRDSALVLLPAHDWIIDAIGILQE